MNLKKKITIRSLLTQAGELPLTKIPFNHLLIISFPDEAGITVDMSAKAILQKLEEGGFTRYLGVFIEDLLVENENRRIRSLVRWSYGIGLLSTAGTLIASLYIGITTGVMPDYWFMAILVIIPAMIMWTQAGVLKSENANSVSKILSGIVPGALKIRTRYTPPDGRDRVDSDGYYQEDEYEHTRPDNPRRRDP